MKMKEVIEKAKEEIGELTILKINTVIGASKDEESGGWKVLVELLEKASIPDAMDLLGTYEVLLNEEGEIVRFERKGLRKRGDTEKVEEYD
jgi:hypothetical protein